MKDVNGRAETAEDSGESSSSWSWCFRSIVDDAYLPSLDLNGDGLINLYFNMILKFEKLCYPLRLRLSNPRFN